MRRTLSGLLAIAVALALLLPWWRNHALLADFCDYGLVMAAVGRMQLGEHPYVDFITPIQTLQFLAAALAENVWGARYLSLTYLNGVFIVVSFWALAAVMTKRLGAIVAVLVAAGIVMASSVQHTIIWYNAMGVVWLALVSTLAAQIEAGQRAGRIKLLVIFAALWVCGMTKVTYQISALALAVTLTIHAASARRTSWRNAWLYVAGYLFFGIVAPVVTELVWTGATFDQWLGNVVMLSGRARTGLIAQMATWQFYLHTPHDYYHPLWFTYAGAWGAGLLLLLALVIGGHLVRARKRRLADVAMLLVLTTGAWICGGVLLATNMEIAYLAGAAWLAMAAAIALGFRGKGKQPTPLSYRITLAVAALTLLIPATEAAWKGTRALWGHEPLVRTEMVLADTLPPRFSYLRGLRIQPSMYDSLARFAETQDKLVARGISPRSFYFVNATEWLVRVVPEARHPGLPLWLATNTTVVDANVMALAKWLEHGRDLSTLFAYDAWDVWYGPLQGILNRDFVASRTGSRFRTYERRVVPEPIEFALATDSNIYTQAMTVTGGPVALQTAADGKTFFGGADSHQLDCQFSLYRLSGEMAGEFQPLNPDDRAEAVFRVFAREGERVADTIWEERVELTATARTFTRTFAVSTGGRPVTLRMELPPGFHGLAGWRRLRSEHSGALRPDVTWPMDRRLKLKHLDESALAALFGDRSHVAEVRAFGRSFQVVPAGANQTGLSALGSSEIWFRTDHASQVTGEFWFPEESWDQGGVRVSVVCYKSGRFDVLYRGDLSPRARAGDRGPVKVHVALPEGMGWIGLIAAPLGGSFQGGDVAWTNVRVW